MTVVFVHGVPETAAIWDPLLDAFGRDDAVALSPPVSGRRYPTGSSPPPTPTRRG